jgi:hypothetical protein
MGRVGGSLTWHSPIPPGPDESSADTPEGRLAAHGFLQRNDASPDSDRTFQVYTLASLRALTPNPEDHIAGDGWLRRGGGTLLTGGTGDGKSVLAEQMAVSIAGGVDILGQIRVRRASRVLYVEAENDGETLQRDLCSIVANALPRACPVTVEANLRFVHVFGLTGHDFAAWLEPKVAQFGPDVVVVDPYQAFVGAADLNASTTFLGWIRPLDAMAKMLRFALLLVAHTPKPRDRDSWTERESVYMAAGSSVISNWARTSAELTQAGEDGRYRLRFGKNAERAAMIDEHGRLVRDLYVEHSGRRLQPFWRICGDQTAPSRGKHDAAIRSAIAENPRAGDKEIAGIVGCDRTTVYRLRRRASSC